jgi:CheY-like chemotaxis protein
MKKEAERSLSEITLIDDEEIVHFIFRSLTRSVNSKCRTESFMDANTVLQQIKNNLFESSCIVLDINMPEMDGWEFLSELEKIEFQVPVYILTSSSHAGDRNKATTFQNVKGYFVKPISVAMIHALLKTQTSS